MAKDKKNKYIDEYDDGGTIADMNIDGMPWYVRRRYKSRDEQNDADGQQLTKEQMRVYKWAAIKAGLVMILVFAFVYFLFIAFCDFVWFR